MLRRSPVFTTPVRVYGWALLVTACATAVTLLFPSFFARNPFPLLYLAAAITAWYGGRGAGLASVLGGAMAADYFSLPPRNRFGFDATDTLFQTLLFLTVAGTITSLIAAGHHRRGVAGVAAVSADEGEEDAGGARGVAARGLPLGFLDLRTHLTVATLAAAQLRRRHVSTIAAARLCAYISRAHAQMLGDIQALEAELSESNEMPDVPS